ncbi:LPXTG-motif cell wall anchor domain-containing protein [Streptomyces albus]|uniref:LPXTG-motif cell wall anchor domain-containing protein n=1 Tax=Streptomyces albus (strain ATCC 21838 / DSM 41398 / FERM P-419 / JCM 4703 / NBRC 107858) TaxID=1081613 RepID=A0A0B5EMU2_STRA4|nr:LPXTG-motif cell wall anchor domain-containing protein [Streptomyces albus]AOU78123.1 LPXTG-motif cell wall anchor domain-containing protein [Streptomyces albus]AYN33878.1 hypothetical protein DUI70_3377 [Streptomyces albus]
MKLRPSLVLAAATAALAPAVLLAAPAASAAPTGGQVVCKDDGSHPFDRSLRTGFSGIPAKIVAGSGFHAFTLHVENTGGRAYPQVDLRAFASQVDDDNVFTDFTHVTLQYKDRATGAWTGVPLDVDQPEEIRGRLGTTAVRPHESFSLALRVALDRTAPTSDASALSTGVYTDAEGNCVYTGEGYQAFRVQKAGAAKSTR